MISVGVDAAGRLRREVALAPGEPLLLHGDGLLAQPGLAELAGRLGQGSGPLLVATDRLRPTVASPADLAAAGLRAIDVPLPTADAGRFDELAGSAGALAQTLTLAEQWWRAGVALYVRVPVGAHNRRGIAALARLLTCEVLGVSRVLYHCSPSLGNRPRDRSAPSPLADLPARLYDAAVELDSARLRVGVEHRDGFGLCLFSGEPEPLRFFHLSASGEPGSSAAIAPWWPYALEAPASQIVRPGGCAGCELHEHCRGLHRNLVGKPGVGRVVPFVAGRPASAGGAGSSSIFTGAPRRLRGGQGLAEAWRGGAEPAAAPRGPREIAPEDLRELGLDGIRLEGFHLILCRVPWLGSEPEPVVPSLALSALVPFLRAAGARVDPVDGKLLLGQSADLAERMGRVGGRRTDVPLDLSGRPGHRAWDPVAEALVESWSPGADLLGLSAEVAECLPLALALVRAWKRRGGGAVVLGGRGLVEPRRVMTRSPALDFCVHGEGEVPLLLLADALRGGRPLDRVPGLSYRQGERLADTHAVVHSLDLHPVPDVSGLALDDYDPVASLGSDEPVFLYQFIVGCPHGCAFCGEHNRYRFRVRHPARVVRDLRFAVEQLGRRRFFFVNNLINVSRRYLDGWLDAMEQARLDLTWCDCCRPAGIHEAQLRRLHRVGCRALTWGLDILSPGLNRRLWKNLSLERAADLLRGAQGLGIRNTVNVILGMPTETEADVQETIRFLLRHADDLDEVAVGVYGFRERSPLGRWPARFGLRRAGDGVDEVGGRPWRTLGAQGRERQQRVIEAVRHAVPVVAPGQG